MKAVNLVALTLVLAFGLVLAQSNYGSYGYPYAASGRGGGGGGGSWGILGLLGLLFLLFFLFGSNNDGTTILFGNLSVNTG